MENIKPYPACKDSGVEWLGQAPAHWDVLRMKSVAVNVIVQTNKRDDNDIYLALEHVESWTGRYRDPGPDVDFDSQVKRFQFGDVLFGKLRPYLAKVAHVRHPGVCVGEFLVLRSHNSLLSSAYLAKLLRSESVIDAVNASTFGAKMPRADWHFMGSMRLPIPPLPEQIAIVRFLNHVERRIQRHIHTKEKLIALLEEQKKAIIQEAVTGRIDVRTGKPYPAYKDSGVEWLGEVPAHWNILRMKSVAANVTVQTNKRDDNDIYLALEHVESWTGRYRDPGPYVDFDSQVKRFQFGDVLFGKLRPYLAKVAHVRHPGVCVGEFLVLRSHNSLLSSAYLAKLLRSESVIDAVNASTFGAKMPRADWHFMGSMRLPIPPLPEQIAIAAFLDQQTADIDAAIARPRRQIELIQEYRTRLISDVVTGKIDVREAAAQLPEQPEEAKDNQ